MAFFRRPVSVVARLSRRVGGVPWARWCVLSDRRAVSAGQPGARVCRRVSAVVISAVQAGGQAELEAAAAADDAPGTG
jgi:hypothetical protein